MSTDCIPQVADHYPVEPLPKGWMTAEVKFRHRDGKEDIRTEIIDLKTQKRYLHEPLRMTAFKCFQLSIGIPFYTAAYLAWNLIRIPTTTIGSLVDGVEKVFSSATCGQVVQRLFDTAWTGVGSVVKGIWTIVRTPFYAIQMFFGALTGIFFPLQGRKILEAESRLHQRTTKSDILRHPIAGGPLESECAGMAASLKDPDCPHTFFAAYCMQPIGGTTDPHIISVRELPLQA